MLALKVFQNEEGPAKNKNSGTGQRIAVPDVEADDQETVTTQETEETGIEKTDTSEDSSEIAPKLTVLDNHDDSKPPATAAPANETQRTEDAAVAIEKATEKMEPEEPFVLKTSLREDSFHDTSSVFVEDDPQTRELVHPAIITTLEALMMVLQDPSKQPRPSEFALECVGMIVANRYLSGRAGGQHEDSSQTLLNRLLESVAKSSESNNELVQNALIATLTSIMTSPKCSVHENAMLTALRSTFHVYLVTKSTTCKASAKRALLDMLRSVFFRMEAHDLVSRSSYNSINSIRTPTPTVLRSAASEDSSESSPSKQASKSAPTFASQYHADAYFLFRSLCKLSSKELPADMTDEAALKAKNAGRLLFNTLIPTDPTELNSKTLSLELILAALEYCGEAFTGSSKFLYLVQHYLCGSLLKNCVSNHTQVAFLSQKIFLVLVRPRHVFLLFCLIVLLVVCVPVAHTLHSFAHYRFTNSRAT